MASVICHTGLLTACQLPETCRVIFNKLEKKCASSWFYYRNIMHGPTNVKLHYQLNPLTVRQTLYIAVPNNCLKAHLLVLYSIFSPMLCMIGSPLSSACPKIACSLGKKRRQSVAVVDVRMSVVIVTNAKVARSEIRFASTTTMALVITTLYTLIPMYCESLRAGIFTCLKKIIKI